MVFVGGNAKFKHRELEANDQPFYSGRSVH